MPLKKPFPLGKLIAAVLAAAVIAGISISVSDCNKQRSADHDAALERLPNEDHTSAEQAAAEEAERQRIAAENAAKREQSLKDQYSGKLPVDGMPVSCLKYTSLGLPDKTEKCRGFDNLVEEKRSYTVYWYDSEGRIQAAGHCFKGKHYEEYMLISFSYYDYSISNSFGHNSTSDNSSDNGASSVRNDYDNPEDLWEDNQDWYEDEDEAWDE